MAAFDNDELIQLSFLRDEETDALIASGFLSDDVRLSSPLDELVVLTLKEVILTVTTGPHYPVHPTSFEITNVSFPREDVDRLRRSLKTITTAAESTNNLENWRRRAESNAYGVFEPVMVVLELAQETVRQLEEYRTRPIRKSPAKDNVPDPSYLFADSKIGVDIDSMAYSTKELAYQLLQASPSSIAARVPDAFRVLHVEQVLRADLARNLQSFQAGLRRTLSQLNVYDLRQSVPHELRDCRREDMVEHLVRPKLTFHGTFRHFVPSIVRHGFSMPGSKNAESGKNHAVRCGSTYGRGIYTSPRADFSLSYTGSSCERTSAAQFFGLKLIVCATVMGRSRVVTRGDYWYLENKPMEGADSHVGNNGLEYVVFDSAQTIPVYVIHLDWGTDNYQYFQDLPADPTSWTARLSTGKRLNVRRLEQGTMLPGDRKREKEAVFAKAAKYFPYGYGPATGTRFVVEEIGEVSEDEEDYGDYQALRAADAAEATEKKTPLDFWSRVKEFGIDDDEETLHEGLHLADEYGWEREASHVPLAFRRPASEWDTLNPKADTNDELLDMGITKLHGEHS